MNDIDSLILGVSPPRSLLPTTFPQVVSNSILAPFRSQCHRLGFWQYMQHWRRFGRDANVHLHSGTAFAAGIAAMRTKFYGPDRYSAKDALLYGLEILSSTYGDFVAPESGSGKVKTLARMRAALVHYAITWPLELEILRPVINSAGQPEVEFSFAVPLPVTHPETDDPIIYAGKYDMNAIYDKEIPFICDEKTTTQLGETWIEQWKLSSQFMGYHWGKEQYGLRNEGIVIRGLAILKEKFNTIEVPPIHFTPAQIDNWFSQTCDLLEEMKHNWKRGIFRQALGFPCARRGKCTFFDACRDPYPEANIAFNFIQEPYNPLGQLEEWE